ncbi:enoyl-CoA hydratase/isomerase family protein [Actinomycetospora termitidis]|uniref:Enoyl-CoA hydratase/isomerase family protein n=1 Tax=Actinomycetospora termitidis TaxID=3053470 RepID=A0ABT7M604_9PSEU|nr:enoyl-CoA hydratase/isomerase family protein [Actinomycetospora sp. Odt1-22]MDL5156096.1 enoyl-CoA hydratase/isomerase family protein [Actinomycetospora sp. Odt1-22]
MSDISTDRVDDVAVVTLHRPPANYFDRALIEELADAFDALSAGESRAAVLASEGKHFCAGADFGAGGAPADRVESSRQLYRAAVRLFEVPIPVVAAVQGAAVGGGLGLACSADFRVTVPTARFHANFAALGFHQGFGLSVTLPRLVGQQRAAELLYTAEKVDGTEAVRLGLADQLAEDSDPLPAALQLARSIARSAPLAVRSMKQTLRAGLADEVARATERELNEQAKLWTTEDCSIGVAANLARKEPRFLGR